MMQRTVPQKISEFLIQRKGRLYCDHCIQERLGLRWRQQVQLVTATLGVTAEFRRTMAACCTCGDTKQVITFLGAVGRLRAGQTLSLPKPARDMASEGSATPLTSSGSA